MADPVSPTAIALWRQLLTEMGPIAARSTGPEMAQRSARRVAAVRGLFWSVLDQIQATELIEVGAAHGEAARRFVQTPGRRAAAYEANPAAYAKALAEGLPERMALHNQAIGSARGEATFYVPTDPKLSQWGSLRRRADRPLDATPITVPMVTLDQAAADMASDGRRMGLWIDVEGAALDVLASGAGALRDRVAAVYVEVCDDDVYEGGGTALEVIGLLAGLGFEMVARDNQFRGAWNLLAVHRETWLAARSIIGAWLMKQMVGRGR